MKKEIQRITEDLLICLGLVVVIIVLVLLTGCCHQKPIQTPSVRDSTAIHVRYRIEYRPILVNFDIPDIQETKTTSDTTSFLENDFAESTATISGGVLTHSLKTKPHTIGIEADVPHERTDSTIFTHHDEVKIKEVEKPLTWWQNTQIIVGRVMIIALIILFLWRLLKCRISILK